VNNHNVLLQEHGILLRDLHLLDWKGLFLKCVWTSDMKMTKHRGV